MVLGLLFSGNAYAEYTQIIKKSSNKDLGKLITDATVYLECHMTVAKIKRIIAEANN